MFLLILIALCLLPMCWICGNKLCAPFDSKKHSALFVNARIFCRAWVSTMFVSIWLGIKPRQVVDYIDDGSDFWEWQVPLYAMLPIVTLFGRVDRVSFCVILRQMAVAAIGSFIAFLVVLFVWAAKASQGAQTFLFSISQPTVSASLALSQRIIREELRGDVFQLHLLQVIITFQSFVYGWTSVPVFWVWKQPVFAFVSYAIGLVFVFISVLFIAPMWECACAASMQADSPSEEGGVRVDASPSTKSKGKDVNREMDHDSDDASVESESVDKSSPEVFIQLDPAPVIGVPTKFVQNPRVKRAINLTDVHNSRHFAETKSNETTRSKSLPSYRTGANPKNLERVKSRSRR